MGAIQVEKNEAETKEIWRFTIIDLTAVFTGYFVYTKPKGKRKWQLIKSWDKYSKRYSSIEEPQLPMHVRSEVLPKLMEMCKVKTWQEHKG